MGGERERERAQGKVIWTAVAAAVLGLLVVATVSAGSVIPTPIGDPVTSTVDHFLPGIAVDKNTSGLDAHCRRLLLPTAN